MPLAAELLLLDEDWRDPSVLGGYHTATARRLYNELSRQLRDPNGQLRRRSAFGVLLSRGCALRLLREEDVKFDSPLLNVKVVEKVSITALQDHRIEVDGKEFPPPPDPSRTPKSSISRTPKNSMSRGVSRGSMSRTPKNSMSRVPSSSSTSPPRRAVSPKGQAQRIKVVPQISRFPQATKRGPATKQGLFDSILSWLPMLPNCGSAACESLNNQVIDSCTIVFNGPPDQAAAPCMSMPASTVPPDPGASEETENCWPLCVPDVRAALIDLGVDPSDPAEARNLAAIRPGHFHNAAMEVDDNELSVIFPRTGIQHCCASASSRSQQATPSTASTASRTSYNDPPPSPTSVLPWMTCRQWKFRKSHRRLVFPRHKIAKSKLRMPPKPDEGASPDRGQSWSHVVEIAGTPHGAPGRLKIALAFPNSELAKRLYEALKDDRPSKSPVNTARRQASKQSRASTSTEHLRRSVRCELRLSANVRLEPEEQRSSCEHVIHRSLCEALGISLPRIRVLNLKEVHGEDFGPPVSGARLASERLKSATDFEQQNRPLTPLTPTPVNLTQYQLQQEALNSGAPTGPILPGPGVDLTPTGAYLRDESPHSDGSPIVE